VGTTIWLEGTKLFSEMSKYMFPNEGRQKHLVRGAKGQWNSKEKDGYRAESLKESYVK